MPMVGFMSLLIAFVGCVVSFLCLGIGHLSGWRGARERAALLAWSGRLAAVIGAVALMVCCGMLVWCFMTGDTSLEYVVQNRSSASGSLAWLFKLSGLWAGRAGSLLLWTFFIAAFGVSIMLRARKTMHALDNVALAVMQLVLIAFLSILLFSKDNMPFTAMNPAYLDTDGNPIGVAALWGMNALLEHWAMAIHPPTLFIGYAGLAVPFAYAIAALVVNDDSALWVDRATGYLMFSWLMLGAGIGLGAIWAYAVLGWGGYWGWDPVENASLLPWLMGVALIHSFTVYRQRGMFRRWSVMCACIAFSFVVLGTFITRSGLVQSVHAFEGDPVSLATFLVLIVLSLLAGVVGLFVRRKSFGTVSMADATGDVLASEDAADSAPASGDAADDTLMSRSAAYYANNLILLVFAVLLAYLTLSSALPAFLPYGGKALSASTYNAIARPLGIVYCALIALCPLLGWHRTEGAAFRKKALVPGVCALALFVALMVFFARYLLPSYQAVIAAGGTAAEELSAQGPSGYYNALAVVGFAVASVLFFNALFMVVRLIRRGFPVSGRSNSWRCCLSALGGGISHMAMAVILIGLIGSSMYVTETAEYLSYDKDADTVAEPLAIQGFELDYQGQSVSQRDNGDNVYTLHFNVYRDAREVGSVDPSMEVVKATQQNKLTAGIINFPEEDLFVVYRGVNMNGDFSMDVRVNPLIGFVWVGFGLLMAGSAIALFAIRRTHRPGES